MLFHHDPSQSGPGASDNDTITVPAFFKHFVYHTVVTEKCGPHILPQPSTRSWNCSQPDLPISCASRAPILFQPDPVTAASLTSARLLVLQYPDCRYPEPAQYIDLSDRILVFRRNPRITVITDLIISLIISFLNNHIAVMTIRKTLCKAQVHSQEQSPSNVAFFPGEP